MKFLPSCLSDFLTATVTTLRILLRRALYRTPPQTETGWIALTSSLPVYDADRSQETVELYSAKDDSICRVFVWSVPAISPVDLGNYYWRRPEPTDEPDRNFAYFSRSLSVLG